MAFADDIQNDYLVFDDVKDATYNPIAAGGSTLPVKVLKHPMTRQGIALASQAQIELQTDDLEIEIFVATMAGNKAYRGDTVTIGAETFWIQTAQLATLASRWHCVVRKNPA